MTLLLKNLWRNVLKGAALSKALRSRNLSSSIASVTDLQRSRSPDALMTSIKSSVSTADVLATVQTNLASLNHKHMLQALRCLFELQRSNKVTSNTDNIVKDPTFGILCDNFNKHARSLDVTEAIEATKVMSYLRVPAEFYIVQTMLQLIRSNINMINIRQIMFLDFLLDRFESKNHLVDALKLALPLAFQIHLPNELDNQDLPLLKDMLAYASTHDLPDRCTNNIVTGLLLHDQGIDAKIAKSIIWSLCQLNCTEERFHTRAQLLHICYDIMTARINEMSFDDILRTAARIKGRILEKHPEYYHEQLMDAIANYVVINEVKFDQGMLVARIMSRIAHTHLGLVEYLCQQAASNPTSLSKARPAVLLSFINCLSNNNFTPDEDQWIQIRRQISENPVLNGKNIALPWAKICLELASLEYFEDRLLCKVFSNENIYDMKRNNKVLDSLQLLTLYEAVRCFHSDKYDLPREVLQDVRALYPIHPLTDQLEEHLARGLGSPEFVVKNIVLPCGFIADCLMCLKSGYPLKLPIRTGDGKLPIEQLHLPSDGLIICIINFQPGCFSMNSNRLRGTFRLVLDILEKQGFAAVPINIQEWMSAPEHEKTAFLMREVGYKCGEMGMKLSAT